MGLHGSVFARVRSSILQMEPLPNIKQIYTMITKEKKYRHLVKAANKCIEEVAFAAVKFRRNSQSTYTHFFEAHP